MNSSIHEIACFVAFALCFWAFIALIVQAIIDSMILYFDRREYRRRREEFYVNIARQEWDQEFSDLSDLTKFVVTKKVLSGFKGGELITEVINEENPVEVSQPAMFTSEGGFLEN